MILLVYFLTNLAADHVTLYFHHFSFHLYGVDDGDCTLAYVSVHEGDGLDGPVLGRYCGTKSQIPITSTGNALTVNLFVEQGYSKTGFGATYSVFDAGES